MNSFEPNHDLDARLRAAFTPPDDVANLARSAATRAIAQAEPRPHRGWGALPPWARSILATAALFLMGFAPLWAPAADALPVSNGGSNDGRGADEVAGLGPEHWTGCSDLRLDAIAAELFPLDVASCNTHAPQPFEQLLAQPAMVCTVGADDETWSPLPGLPGLAWLGHPLLSLSTPLATEDGGHRLSASLDGQRAVLLIHPAAVAPTFRLGSDARLRVHRKEVAGYVVHEFGASGTSRFLERIDRER